MTLLKLKDNLKDFLPPILLHLLRSKSKYGWFGNYSSWEEAQQDCVGYDADVILEKCKQAALKVTAGEALFERDSVLFYKPEYSWLILSGVLHCAVENKGKVEVLDFGGSFGSSYYQYRSFFATVKNLSLQWHVVEQKKFVECGKKYFEAEKLKFYHTIEDCLAANQPNILLLASVLQYLEDPFKWLDKFLSLDIEYVILDKTAFTKSAGDIISVQKVSPVIYDASYPAWIFNEEKFLKQLSPKYDVILENNNEDESNYDGMYFKGYILKLKH